VESWDGTYSIEAGSATRINCLNFLPYGVLTTHRCILSTSMCAPGLRQHFTSELC
jgi:hypothetical protein